MDRTAQRLHTVLVQGLGPALHRTHRFGQEKAIPEFGTLAAVLRAQRMGDAGVRPPATIARGGGLPWDGVMLLRDRVLLRGDMLLWGGAVVRGRGHVGSW